jgi:acyl-CoA synthetase (NDP forming)
MSADAAELHSVPLPQPTDKTLEVLRAHIPEYGSVRNPCDVTAQVTSNQASILAVGNALMSDPNYGVVVMPFPQAYPASGGRNKVFSEIAESHGKMSCNVWISEWPSGPGSREGEELPRMAIFRSMERCFGTLAAWHKREDKRAAGPRQLARVSPIDAKDKAARLLDAARNKTLTEREAKEVLAAYGVPVVGEQLVQSIDECVTAAEKLGFPVALKVESPDLPHKTEAGVIRLNLKSPAEVCTAFEAVMANAHKVSPPPRINGVLVQPMVPPGTEIMVGARVDPLFGPLIVVGLGGILVELLKDTAVELAPINKTEAGAMLGRLKAQAALTGFRGSEPVDQEQLADVIVRLAEFAADQQDRIAELDVNPLICAGSRIVAVDALIVRNV